MYKYQNKEGKEHLVTAFTQGSLLIDAAADQLIAFTKTVTEPAQAFAPWICTRGVIEAASVAAYLLDPDIEAQERVRRGLARRHQGLAEQARFLRATKEHANEWSCFMPENAATQVESRITLLKKEACAMGFLQPKKKENDPDKPNIEMPSYTWLATQLLDGEPTYRLLSGFAHANEWVQIALSMRKTGQTSAFVTTETGNTTVYHLEKVLSAEHVALLCTVIVRAFNRPIWHKTRLYGFNTKRLQEILEPAFYNLRIGNEDYRFWVKPTKSDNGAA
jgi:hypothetical protein